MNQTLLSRISVTNIVIHSWRFFGVLFVLISFSSPIVTALAQSEATVRARAALPRGETKNFGTPPTVTTGPLHTGLRTAIDTAFGDNLRTATFGTAQIDALQRIADFGDVRVAWIVSGLRCTKTYSES